MLSACIGFIKASYQLVGPKLVNLNLQVVITPENFGSTVLGQKAKKKKLYCIQHNGHKVVLRNKLLLLKKKYFQEAMETYTAEP